MLHKIHWLVLLRRKIRVTSWLSKDANKTPLPWNLGIKTCFDLFCFYPGLKPPSFRVYDPVLGLTHQEGISLCGCDSQWQFKYLDVLMKLVKAQEKNCWLIILSTALIELWNDSRELLLFINWKTQNTKKCAIANLIKIRWFLRMGDLLLDFISKFIAKINLECVFIKLQYSPHALVSASRFDKSY